MVWQHSVEELRKYRNQELTTLFKRGLIDSEQLQDIATESEVMASQAFQCAYLIKTLVVLNGACKQNSRLQDQLEVIEKGFKEIFRVVEPDDAGLDQEA